MSFDHTGSTPGTIPPDVAASCHNHQFIPKIYSHQNQQNPYQQLILQQNQQQQHPHQQHQQHQQQQQQQIQQYQYFQNLQQQQQFQLQQIQNQQHNPYQLGQPPSVPLAAGSAPTPTPAPTLPPSLPPTPKQQQQLLSTHQNTQLLQTNQTSPAQSQPSPIPPQAQAQAQASLPPPPSSLQPQSQTQAHPHTHPHAHAHAHAHTLTQTQVQVQAQAQSQVQVQAQAQPSASLPSQAHVQVQVQGSTLTRPPSSKPPPSQQQPQQQQQQQHQQHQQQQQDKTPSQQSSYHPQHTSVTGQIYQQSPVKPHFSPSFPITSFPSESQGLAPPLPPAPPPSQSTAAQLSQHAYHSSQSHTPVQQYSVHAHGQTLSPHSNISPASNTAPMIQFHQPVVFNQSTVPVDASSLPNVNYSSTVVPAFSPVSLSLNTSEKDRELERQRIDVLLEINSLLLAEIIFLQSQGKGGLLSLTNAQLPVTSSRNSHDLTNADALSVNDDGYHVDSSTQSSLTSPQSSSSSVPNGPNAKLASKEYMELMRRVQTNLTYVATVVERHFSKPHLALPPGPAIMTPPSGLSNTLKLYARLQALFPGWKGGFRPQSQSQIPGSSILHKPPHVQQTGQEVQNPTSVNHPLMVQQSPQQQHQQQQHQQQQQQQQQQIISQYQRQVRTQQQSVPQNSRMRMSQPHPQSMPQNNHHTPHPPAYYPINTQLPNHSPTGQIPTMMVPTTHAQAHARTMMSQQQQQQQSQPLQVYVTHPNSYQPSRPPPPPSIPAQPQVQQHLFSPSPPLAARPNSISGIPESHSYFPNSVSPPPSVTPGAMTPQQQQQQHYHQQQAIRMAMAQQAAAVSRTTDMRHGSA